MKIKYKIKEWDEILRPGDCFTVKRLPNGRTKYWGNANYFSNNMYEVIYIEDGRPFIKWRGTVHHFCDNLNVLDGLQKIHPKDYRKYKLTTK